MNTFVLIHGAWHGAWCWKYITPLLRSKGHKVIAPDLPGHGLDTTPARKVNLEKYVGSVCQELDKIEERIILVGHSMGGIIISEAAERRPAKLQALVYLSAFLPMHGDSLAGMEQRNPHTAVPPNLVPAGNGLTATVRDDKITYLFYHDCPDEDVEYAKRHLCPQAMGLLNTPVSLTEENYGRVPRYYILCTEDRALHPEFQQAMVDAAPATTTHTLASGHSPFFSVPDRLAEVLLEIGEG